MRGFSKILIFAFLCGATLTSCGFQSELTNDEVIILSNGRTIHLENHQWLKELIDLSKADKTGNFWGCIWLENYKGKDIFVTNMMFGSGGVMYYYFDSSGASIINKEYEKYPNPFIESFTGKASFVEVDEGWLNDFRVNMKLNVVVYSSFSFPCK